MYYLYPVLAIALTYIGFLGLYQKKNTSTLFMFILNISLALWVVCNFVIYYPEYVPFLKAFVSIKLIAIILSSLGLYGFSLSYPVSSFAKKSKIISIVLSLLILSCIVIVFPSYFIIASLEEGKIVGEIQVGYLFYGIAIISIYAMSFFNLHQASKKYPEYKGALTFLNFSLGVVGMIALFTNIVLLNLGIHQFIFVGRLLGPLGFSFFMYYSILKYDLLHIRFLMKPAFIWLNLLLTLVIFTFVVLCLTDFNSSFQTISILCIVALSAYFGHIFQSKLGNSMKKALLPGWYDRQELLKSLIHELTYIFDQDKIFECVKSKIASSLEINKITLIKSSYRQNSQLKEYFLNNTTPALFTELPKIIQTGLLQVFSDYTEKAVILPLVSPQDVKGIFVIGARESGYQFTEQDLELFLQIQNIVSASLYRISPQSEIEKAYYQTKDKIEWMHAFAGNIAHELRTPLAAISLSNKCIERAVEKMEEKQKESAMHSVNTINAVTNKAQKTISMLLENIKNRKLSISDLKQQSMAGAIQTALNEYPFDYEEDQLIQFDASKDFDANISKEMLIIVLFNLLKNALYFIKAAGKGHIKIRLERDKQYNKIIVLDTAKGIAKENLHKIFDPFYSNKRNAQGHGLGLSFCKHIMQEHNGDITCNSEEGEYTEFELLFPVCHGQ